MDKKEWDKMKTKNKAKLRKGNQIEVIIFRNEGKEGYKFLLLKRIESRGGFWQPITGGIEENETAKEAVKREIKEEIGIKNIIRLIEDVYHFVLKENAKEESVFGVEVSINEKITLAKNIYTEHDNYKWCSFDEALNLLKYSGNKEGLKALYKILK
jgi:8-oxo-dGTP pyrophosphatase MutT (NUDIX family)